MEEFKQGDYIVYVNGDRFEIGRIKSVLPDGAFVYYSEGGTAAKTPFDCIHKLVNDYTIMKTSLGYGDRLGYIAENKGYKESTND